jgi:hypothetical protein
MRNGDGIDGPWGRFGWGFLICSTFWFLLSDLLICFNSAFDYAKWRIQCCLNCNIVTATWGINHSGYLFSLKVVNGDVNKGGIVCTAVTSNASKTDGRRIANSTIPSLEQLCKQGCFETLLQRIRRGSIQLITGLDFQLIFMLQNLVSSPSAAITALQRSHQQFTRASI